MRLAVVMALVVVVMAWVGVVEGKVYSKCELAKELETIHMMKREDVKKWVCIAQYESTFNSGAINHANWDGSKDYGLFQLNNKYWCDDDYGKNVCRIPCSALLDGDLTNDLKCIAKIIRDTERWKGKGTGLTAWVAYVNKCQNKNLDEYMAECWTDPNASNTIGLREEYPINNILPNIENAPGAGGHDPIINNARVPIRVISNMHPTYMYLPVYPPAVRANPYSFFFH